jgi:hypothetical protein
VTLPATETPQKPQIAEAVLNQRLGLECFARSGLPPEKWSSLRYGSRELKEDVSDVEEEAQA